MKLRFLNIIFLLLTLILPTTYFAHIDIFDIYQGQFIPNQKWNKNFCFDIEFQNNIHIDEIGIDYFDVGENDSSLIEILIFDNTNKIFTIKKRIDKIYNQTLLLPINKYLKKGQYRIQINNFDNDDVISLFKPNLLPYKGLKNFLETKKIFINQNDNLSETKSHPFVHFGASIQEGIDLSLGNDFIGFNKELTGTEFIFSTQQNQKCIKVGLNNFSLDSGIIHVKITKNKTGELLFERDTTINTFIQSFDFKLNLDFISNELYVIQYSFEKFNNLYINQFINIPQYDNSNQVKLIQFKTKKKNINEFLKDTLGFAVTLSFEQNTLNLDDMFNKTDEFFFIKNGILFIQKNQPYNKTVVYDILGNIINSEIKNDLSDDFHQFKLSNPGVYIVSNENKTFKFLFSND